MKRRIIVTVIAAVLIAVLILFAFSQRPADVNHATIDEYASALYVGAINTEGPLTFLEHQEWFTDDCLRLICTNRHMIPMNREESFDEYEARFKAECKPEELREYINIAPTLKSCESYWDSRTRESLSVVFWEEGVGDASYTLVRMHWTKDGKVEEFQARNFQTRYTPWGFQNNEVA